MNRNKLTIITAALCLIITFGSVLTSAQTSDLRPLTTGQVIERELKGDEAHSYSLALTAGQYLNLVVEQKGIDVVVTLFDANGKKVIEVDSPNGTQGKEPIIVITETAGNYRLEVRSLEKTAAGRYEVKINELRTVTEKDKNRLVANNLLTEADALLQQGTAKLLRNAIKKYEEALSFFRAVEDRKNEAEMLDYIGQAYYYLGENQQALKSFNDSLLLFRAVGDKFGEATEINNIGRIYDDLGEKQRALKLYNESLLLFRAIGSKSDEAETLSNIAGIYSDLSDKQQALKFYNESLALRRAIGDKSSIARTLSNIGTVYGDLGEQQQALKFFDESLSLFRAVGDKRGEASTLNNIGAVYSALGENQQALIFFNESLQIKRALGNKFSEAVTLSNIAGIYSDLGDKQQALKLYNEVLLLAQAVGNKFGEAATLNNIGRIYDDLGDNQQALKYFNKALPLFHTLGDKSGAARTLNNIGTVYSALGEKQQALKFYNEALPFTRASNSKSDEAVTLSNIGTIYADLREIEKALEYFAKALPLRRTVGDKEGEANTLENLFYTLAATDNPRFGIYYGKQSVNNLQILRSNVQGLDKNLQQSFLKSIERTYRRLADALIKQQRFAEAQQVLNSFKDQQSFDFSQSKLFAPLAVTVREAELTKTLNQKLENVVAAIRAVDAFKRGIGARQPNADETAQLKVLTDKQIAANDDYLAFLKSAEKEFAAPLTEKNKAPVVLDLTELQTALRKLSAETGEKSVAVYTLVGVDNFRALVVTSDSISSVSTPIEGVVLNEKAKQLWSLLRTPEFDPQPLAKEIYDAVFAPLAAKLPADTKTILWSLDGNLRYLPMAALHDGKSYLVERYNNVIFTRADTERLTRSVSANLTGTGFGASEQRRVKIGDENFNAFALPSVKTELARIFKTDNSATGILSGEVLLDARFTRSAMISTLQKRRPLVHIASHFVFVPGDEAKSFLLLGDGSPFTLDEIKKQKDFFAGVELLTLSACETAAQQEDANGREIDGFAELAQRLGAGAVMASLWNVSDDSTAELMARFYKTYNNQEGANKASSLRAAQLAILRGEFKTATTVSRQATLTDTEVKTKIKIDRTKLKPFVPDKNAPFAHPFYWSPFILIGNWK